MANTTGKKARKTGGTRAAIKRRSAAKPQRKFGTLLKLTPAEVEDVHEIVRKKRLKRTGDPSANIAVEL